MLHRTWKTAGAWLTFPGTPGSPLGPSSPWGKRQSVHRIYMLTATAQPTPQSDHRRHFEKNKNKTTFLNIYLVALFTFWPKWSFRSSFSLYEKKEAKKKRDFLSFTLAFLISSREMRMPKPRVNNSESKVSITVIQIFPHYSHKLYSIIFRFNT